MDVRLDGSDRTTHNICDLRLGHVFVEAKQNGGSSNWRKDLQNLCEPQCIFSAGFSRARLGERGLNPSMPALDDPAPDPIAVEIHQCPARVRAGLVADAGP